MGPCDPARMQAVVEASPGQARYGEALDRESARELLAARLARGAEEAERAQAEQAEPVGSARQRPIPLPRTPARRRTKAAKEQRSTMEQVLGSPEVRDILRTATREITRGIFGTARRRR